MNFFIYSVFIAANMGTIFLLPNQDVNLFLKTYSAASFFFGVLFIYIYSKKNVSIIINKLHVPLFLLFSLFFVISGYLDSRFLLAITYSAVFIYTDYLVSQSAKSWKLNIYRIGTMALVVLCYLDFANGKNYIIESRCLFALLFIILFIKFKDELISPLKIDGAIFYILFTNAVYYCSLYLIALLIASVNMRFWYIALQIGLSLQLKISDYKIRKNGSLNRWLINSISLASFLIGLVMAFYDFNFLALLIYMCSIALMFGYLRFIKIL